jgi:cytochrome c553
MIFRRRAAIGARVIAVVAIQAASGASAQAPAADAPLAPGVQNAQRAWQHWVLNCQGCHRPDGTGSEATAPSIAGTVARFLHAPGGREYLGQVPGVATSPLGDADLAEVLNWMLWRFDAAHIPATFQPYTADEVGRLRQHPLRIEASRVRNDLLKKAATAPARATARGESGAAG